METLDKGRSPRQVAQSRTVGHVITWLSSWPCERPKAEDSLSQAQTLDPQRLLRESVHSVLSH